MRTMDHTTVQIGQLIAAAFDEAAKYTTDPREVSRLATRAVTRMLRRARRALISPHTAGRSARASAG